MGTNNKKNQPNAQYGSGGDPRGRVQNQSAHQQERYENQQGPMVNAFAYNYGRGADTDFNNYNDIMSGYRNVALGGGGKIAPRSIGYSDPFKSYAGMEEFSQTGGYSPEDIANMRARGNSPIRAAYSNAEREVGRQRSLQGGYSPNATATLAKMAREQGQSAADATTNVEAGLAEARNRGRQFGLSGMGNIEGQRLGADLDVGKFNANAGMMADEANSANQLRALQGASSLYGTTPGMAQTFGNQLLQGVGQGGNFGLGLMGQDIASQQLPGQYDETKGWINDAATAAYPWLDMMKKKKAATNGLPGYSSGPF